MKTVFLSSLAALCVCTAAVAQTPITLSNVGYPGLGSDTIQAVANVASFTTASTAAVNGSWDLSTASYTGVSSSINRLAPTNPNISGATFRSALFTNFGAISYSTQAYYALSATGVTQVGEEVATRQAIGLGSVSGNMNDSLIFPAQTIVMTGGPRKVFPFPATISSSWSASVNETLNFNVTIGAFGLNNTPGQRRALRIYQDSVIGWGRTRVLNPVTGMASGWMDVLQVRSRQITRDSFYLGGSPASDTLLSSFGLQQGQGDTSISVYFYRMSEYTPLAELYYDGNVSSGAPNDMFVSTTRLASPTSIGGVARAAEALVYPNPVRGNAVSVKLPAAGAFRYQITALNGAVITEGTLKTSPAGDASVMLPTGATAGIYYLSLQNEGTDRIVMPFSVER